MAPTTLYNKWRPRSFADVRDRPLVGQEPVARTLRQAIQRQQVAHAYLFCGPRGTGKTSAARIFARAINCLAGLHGEPCNRCANCTAMLDGRQLDLLVEIDAASNRGVEDARSLRERLLQRPGGDGLTGRYKVYIIDEVHMLTREAFNTLLKSLEEPPPHVIFILATTDPQEVLPTILSRCQRFDFRPISLEHLVAHLAHVAGEEGVAVETRALETLARAARGGLRDAIGLLDQAFAFAGAGGANGARQVSAVQVDAMLGLSRTDVIAEVVRALGDADLASVLRATHAALEGGADVRAFSRQVVEALRAILLVIGGAPEATNLEPGLRDTLALHARRFTLGRTIRAIKALAALDAGLRTRGADAALLFEVAVAEIVAEASGALGTSTTSPETSPPSPRSRNDASAPRSTGPTRSTAPSQGHIDPPRVHDGPAPRRDVPVTADPRYEASGVRVSTSADRDDADGSLSLVAQPARQGSDRPDGEAVDAAPPSTPVDTRPEQTIADPPGPIASSSQATDAGSLGTDTGSWPTSDPPTRTSPRDGAWRRGAAQEAPALTDAVSRWSAVIERIGGDGMAPLVGLLQGSVPSGIDPDGAIAVSCGSTFFVQKLREPANQVGVERCASQVLGTPVRLRFHVAGGVSDTAGRRTAPSGAQDGFVARAARMLGGRALAPEEVERLDKQATLPLEGLPD